MFPKTMDEIKASAENEQILAGSMPDVLETDEHTTHIYTHMMVMPKSWELWFHLDWHQKLLAEQKKQEMDAMAQQMQAQSTQSAGQSTQSSPLNKPKVGKEKSSPMAAASPLKSEITSDNLK
jgi:hypothetical protein